MTKSGFEDYTALDWTLFVVLRAMMAALAVAVPYLLYLELFG